MLTPTLTRALGAVPRSGARALSTTAMKQSRTPGMGDINPSAASVQKFSQNQKEFRESMVELQKQRGARALAAQQSTESSSIASSENSPNSSTGAQSEAKSPQPERKNGPLSNLIYGTKEGREMDAQIEASFSQVLARGKYVHSIVFHEVKPECVDEYVELVGKFYPKMAGTPENKVHLVGSWRTEVGDCNAFGTLIKTPCCLLLI